MTPLFGQHTIEEAPGAWPNGSRVRKIWQEKGDPHVVGSLAMIVGSIGPMPASPDVPPDLVGHYGYFVRWDDMPALAVFVADVKLELVESPS